MDQDNYNQAAALVALRTDPGRDPEKQVNEDACAEQMTRFGHLVVVCDGMGGHAGGREASELAVRTIREVFATAAEAAPAREVLAQSLCEANRRIFTMTVPDEQVNAGRPGSTVVAALLRAEGTEIAHVGDSRAYLVHAGQIFPLTKDHSMVQRLVDEGVISPSDAMRHPDANKILRALGVGPDVDVDVRAQAVPHVVGDVIVLCSDGLSDLVSPEDILAIAGGAPPLQAAGQLVDLANARGGHDNVTVAVVRPRESAIGWREPVAPTVPQTVVHAAMPTVMQMPALPPSSTMPRRETGRASRVVIPILAVFVALVGVAVAVIAIYMYMSERRGARHRAPDVGNEPMMSPSSVHPQIELAPMPSAPVPAQTADEPDAGIAPLVPIDAGRRRRR